MSFLLRKTMNEEESHMRIIKIAPTRLMVVISLHLPLLHGTVVGNSNYAH
ncbi:MAG: hypothetical protein K0S41_207 [Anaerocolumna sp.]|jgi:hypothetical protein|nr:hypothetical protein [Anaerocolumna sp.]